MGRSSCYFGSIGTDFEDSIWLALSRSGAICVTLSFSIHVFASYEVTRIAIHHVLTAVLYGVFYVPFTFMALWSLFMAYTSDPGAVPMGAKPLETGLEVKMRGIRRCRKCNDNFKPPRAHHDSNTGRCIVKMDHFCPWICNAVGVYNHKFFILFILYSCFTCIFSIIISALTYFRCEAQRNAVSVDSDDKPRFTSSISLQEDYETSWHRLSNRLLNASNVAPDNDTTPETTVIPYPSIVCNAIVSIEALVLFIVSIIFLLFTLSMLVEQYDAIRSNISKIARLIIIRDGQNETTEGYDRVSSKFNEIFGGETDDFAWHWLVPIPIWFMEGMHDQVMGYTWEPPPDDDDSDGRASPVPLQLGVGEGDTELSSNATPPNIAFGLNKRTGGNSNIAVKLKEDTTEKEERANLLDMKRGDQVIC